MLENEKLFKLSFNKTVKIFDELQKYKKTSELQISLF